MRNIVALLISVFIFSLWAPADVMAADAQCEAYKGDIKPLPINCDNDIKTYGLIDQKVMTNICRINEAIDFKVSEYMVLGNAIMCYATEFGAKDISILGHHLFYFPHLTMLFSGCIIFILGGTLMMAVGYYLIDISFKLGFSILALPIGIAFWPFKKTEKKVFDIIGLMFNSAGVLIFLSLGATFGVALFGAAFSTGGGLDGVYENINNGKTEPLVEVLDLGTIKFLVLVFAGVCSFQLFGKTVESYTKKFFKDITGIGGENPMHKSATQATAVAAKPVKAVAGYAGDVAKTQTKRGAAAVGRAAGKPLKKAANAAGKGVQKASAAAGKGVQKASAAAGKGISAAGAAAGNGLKAAGSAMQAIPIVGNIAGAAMIAAGAATSAAAKVAGKAVEISGKVAGKAVEASGKVAGKAVEKAGNAPVKAAEKVEKDYQELNKNGGTDKEKRD